jgi:hypothetical protein
MNEAMEGIVYWVWYSAALAVGCLELGVLLLIVGGAAVKFIKNKKGK